MNLVNNALKFTKDGNVTTKTKLESLQNGNAIVSFKIIDTGIGIPKDKLETVLKVFTRLSGNKPQIRRNRLRLTIVKKLIKI
jgi:signal transduction histidine kinase